MEINFSRLVTPDPINPPHIPDPVRAERNLLAAILERAVKDAAGCFDIDPLTGGLNPKYCAYQALEWITSDDIEYCPISFLWLCEMLDLSPDRLRDGIICAIKSKSIGATVLTYRRHHVRD